MSFERLILASQSPRRIELLRQLGISFEVYPSSGDEPSPEAGETPAEYTKRLAIHKGRQVQQTFEQPDLWILAADTVVVHQQEILNKPGNEAEAKAMLQALSGEAHSVITGFVVLNQSRGIEHKEHCTTKVWFRNISALTIQRYVKTGEPMDKAGAYGIQGKAAAFIDKIEGSYPNVVGLPVARVLAALEQHGAGTFL